MAGAAKAAAAVDETALQHANHIEPPAPVLPPEPEPDRVAMVSVRRDGTADQREGYEVIAEMFVEE